MGERRSTVYALACTIACVVYLIVHICHCRAVFGSDPGLRLPAQSSIARGEPSIEECRTVVASHCPSKRHENLGKDSVRDLERHLLNG